LQTSLSGSISIIKSGDMTDITLAQALRIIDAALSEARKLNLQPMTVAVLDRGGHLTALKREDNSGNMRAEIAVAKARGALGLGQSTRVMSERVGHLPHFFAAIAALTDGNVIPVPGGVLIRDTEMRVRGAIGISGDTADNDETCALVALAAVSLSN
jgi:uncharacterized protein GlcG (DUF336 family)